MANSWIYNTRSRYQIDTYNPSGNTLTTKSDIESVSLRKSDKIEILIRNSQEIASGYDDLEVIDIANKTVTLDNSLVGLGTTTTKYDLRRKLKKSTSAYTTLQFSPNVISDVQNTYCTDYTNEEEGEYLYVASNSLPSYQIETKTFNYDVLSLSGYNDEEGKSTIINFTNEISFITGDRVYYQCSDEPILGLEDKTSYYVEVLSDKKSIKIYTSVLSVQKNICS